MRGADAVRLFAQLRMLDDHQGDDDEHVATSVPCWMD